MKEFIIRLVNIVMDLAETFNKKSKMFTKIC